MEYYLKHLDSPVGKLQLVATNQGLAAILWEGEDFARTKLAPPVPADNHPILLETERQLLEYLRKERIAFEVPLDFASTDFQKRVWAALLTIPFGKTKTYGELAQQLGDAKAVRAVGGALNKNPISIIIPCHRVIGASGKLVGFAGGLSNKSCLLQIEGIIGKGLFD